MSLIGKAAKNSAPPSGKPIGNYEKTAATLALVNPQASGRGFDDRVSCSEDPAFRVGTGDISGGGGRHIAHPA